MNNALYMKYVWNANWSWFSIMLPLNYATYILTYILNILFYIYSYIRIYIYRYTYICSYVCISIFSYVNVVYYFNMIYVEICRSHCGVPGCKLNVYFSKFIFISVRLFIYFFYLVLAISKCPKCKCYNMCVWVYYLIVKSNRSAIIWLVLNGSWNIFY